MTFGEIAAKTFDVTQSTKMCVRRLRHVVLFAQHTTLTIDAVQSTSKDPILRLPTLGGSLPLSIITDHLRTITITVPIANYDNNQHAENENIRLQNLWDGIESWAAVMMIKPKV